MSRMRQKTKHALVLLTIVVAMGLLGHMEARDAQCSWNGCPDNRFEQEG